MDLTTFVLEQALKQLGAAPSVIRQLSFASNLSNVSQRGFPKELLQLSIPMVVRGLHNYGVLQMDSSWIYPYWVRHQLDPSSAGFIPRSQNPLLLNITNRSWTLIGSPHGTHEAIVDPRGLLTPLPHEWSLDVWMEEEGEFFFPSQSKEAEQHGYEGTPNVITVFSWKKLELILDAFVITLRGSSDVALQNVTVKNESPVTRQLMLYFAIRPFNPEGIAPIESLALKHNRSINIDQTALIMLSDDPDFFHCQSGLEGDIGHYLQQQSSAGFLQPKKSCFCSQGLANAVYAHRLKLGPNKAITRSLAIPLSTKEPENRSPLRSFWQISFEQRKADYQRQWQKELSIGASFKFGVPSIQDLFDASRLTLLQLHDENNISPGPWLYHHFWFRDATPMIWALDLLGFSDRTRQVLDHYFSYQTNDGFFRAPDGEWDSNGAALRSLFLHYQLTQSKLWLKRKSAALLKAGRWISRMFRTSDTHEFVRGLMPPSLSAEHLGTVDQYYWDSFWSLSGLYALLEFSLEFGWQDDHDRIRQDIQDLEHSLLQAVRTSAERRGDTYIASTPRRVFDESAIGSLACIYPLRLHSFLKEYAESSLNEFSRRYIGEQGFYHPIIHSGYNAYLTLQVAHAYLDLNDTAQSWKIANAIFIQASPTNAFPEAIHPLTGGGSMGDGHHGWAAAEVILFLRDCLLREHGTVLQILSGYQHIPYTLQLPLQVINAPTVFGQISFSLKRGEGEMLDCSFKGKYFHEKMPLFIDFYFPGRAIKVVSPNPQKLVSVIHTSSATVIRCLPTISTLLIHPETGFNNR